MLQATVSDVHLGIDYKAMAEAQKDDPEVQILHTEKSNLVIKEVAFTGDESTLHVYRSGKAYCTYQQETTSL